MIQRKSIISRHINSITISEEKEKREGKEMALGILTILFICMSIISGLGILLLYLIKEEKKKKIIFYSLSVWGIIIAVFSATSLPTNYVGSQLVSWGIGVLSIIGIIVYLKAKTKLQYQVAYLLTTASVVFGMLKLFF